MEKVLAVSQFSGRGRRRLSRCPYLLAAAGGNGARSTEVLVWLANIYGRARPSCRIVTWSGVEGLGAGDKQITRGVVENRDAVEPGPRQFLIAYLACLAPPRALGRWPNHTTYSAPDGDLSWI